MGGYVCVASMVVSWFLWKHSCFAVLVFFLLKNWSNVLKDNCRNFTFCLCYLFLLMYCNTTQCFVRKNIPDCCFKKPHLAKLSLPLWQSLLKQAECTCDLNVWCCVVTGFDVFQCDNFFHSPFHHDYKLPGALFSERRRLWLACTWHGLI